MGNVYMEASQINYRGGEKKMSVEEALKNTSGEAAAIAQLQADVSNLSDIKANQITIAPAFSAETAYDPGDIVYYNGLSYRCVNAHEGEWDADDFAATTIANELAEVKSGLTSLDFGKMIYDGTGVNIDTIITPGWHYGSSTGAGLDTVDDYYMIVFHLGNYIKQFIIGKFGYGNILYMRYSGDGGSSWSVSKITFTSVS